MKSGRLLRAALALLVAAPSVHANVSRFWEWETDPATNQPRRELTVAVNPNDADTLIGGVKLKDLVAESVTDWNAAATGWKLTLVPVATGADIFVQTRSGIGDGGAQATFETRDGKGAIVNRVIEIDPAGVAGSFQWGTTGATKDPRAAMKHEFSHVLKLSHEGGDRATSGRILDAGGNSGPIIGDHAHNALTAQDIADAKASAIEVFKPRAARVQKDSPAVEFEMPFSLPGEPGAFLRPTRIGIGPGFFAGAATGCGFDLGLSQFGTDWAFGSMPAGLLTQNLRGVEIQVQRDACFDPATDLAAGAMIDFSFSLATGANGELFDFAQPDFAEWVTDDLVFTTVAMNLDGDATSRIDMSALAWSTLQPTNLLVDRTDPDQVGISFGVSAASFFGATGEALARSIGIATRAVPEPGSGMLATLALAAAFAAGMRRRGVSREPPGPAR